MDDGAASGAPGKETKMIDRLKTGASCTLRALGLVVVVMMGATVAQGCDLLSSALEWPEVAQCGPQADDLFDVVVSTLLSDGQGDLSERTVNALEDLARDYSADAVACVVDVLVQEWTPREGASADPLLVAGAQRGRAFLGSRNVDGHLGSVRGH